MYCAFVFLLAIAFLGLCQHVRSDAGEYHREKTHLRKDPRDYTDRDIDSLYDEWEVSMQWQCFLLITV
jgi:hypothetical protein